MRYKYLLALFFSFLMVVLPMAHAAEEEPATEGEAKAEKKEPLMYFMITPNVLTFYQDTGKKIGYIVVQVQVVVRGQDHFDIVENHLPLMQDALTDFFNRQDKTTVQDLSQRESLRKQAKDVVAAVIKEEVKKDVVENLLFTQYIFQ